MTPDGEGAQRATYPIGGFRRVPIGLLHLAPAFLTRDALCGEPTSTGAHKGDVAMLAAIIIMLLVGGFAWWMVSAM